MARLITLAALALATLARANGNATQQCLCTHDQSCWPPAHAFAALQAHLSHPLVWPRPTAWPCYPPAHPAGDCAEVQAQWSNGTWRASQPGALEMANWEPFVGRNGTVDACFLDTSLSGTCAQGRVSVVGVDARTVADVQAAIAFAVQHTLKLVVKNTGHDYVGRSSGRGTFQVWTHNMKNISYAAAFVPQGGPGNATYPALTVGAGVQWSDAYAAVHAHNRLMVGGISAGGSVGAAGGWLMGGGHSFTSPTYGLGVDNVLEISLVLSSGEYVVANAYQNTDLFWALRGGGGGTYGIVTSVTYLTYPDVPVQVYSFQATTPNPTVQHTFVIGFLQYQGRLAGAGWGGYGAVSSDGLNFTYYAPGMANDTVATSIQDWQNWVDLMAFYGIQSQYQTSYYPSWYDVVQDMMYSGGQDDVGGYSLVTSQLISQETPIGNNISQIADLLINCTAGFNAVAGGKVSQVDPEATGLNPAWRNAIIEMTCATAWEEETPLTTVQAQLADLRQWIQDMYGAAPTDGVSFNEATPFQVEWQTAFFGDHYDTLKSIKDTYDPQRLFVVTEGVGSEEWNKALTCRS